MSTRIMDPGISDTGILLSVFLASKSIRIVWPPKPREKLSAKKREDGAVKTFPRFRWHKLIRYGQEVFVGNSCRGDESAKSDFMPPEGFDPSRLGHKACTI
ncbi:hypothetical protein ABVK25_008570 [Lepraria finkii]|uniref:Uncharacterized protein n=1 Tax=Lepraria finkii TaxID=1340010 RepID=A0ABR4B2E6_9LECA